MKTTIDHKIRVKLGITCDEYVLMDYLANTKLRSLQDATSKLGVCEGDIHSLGIKLTDLGLLIKIDGKSQVTELWKKHFDNTPFIKDVIETYNKITASDLSPKTKSYAVLINARLKEKDYTLEDFKLVIESKTKEWGGTDQERYLRPETLFNGKFASYLDFAKKEKKEPEKKMIM